MKRVTSVSVDDEVLKLAKDGMLNVSELLENAIKNKLNFKEIKFEDKCFFCHKSEEHACEQNSYMGLTYLSPDERWICDSCLHSKMRSVT